jgi:hypothetical protein
MKSGFGFMGQGLKIPDAMVGVLPDHNALPKNYGTG